MKVVCLLNALRAKLANHLYNLLFFPNLSVYWAKLFAIYGCQSRQFNSFSNIILKVAKSWCSRITSLLIELSQQILRKLGERLDNVLILNFLV